MNGLANRALEICQENVRTSRAHIADPAPDHRDLDVERLRTAMIFVNCKPEMFRKDFAGYLAENFHVYLAFEVAANKIWNIGHRHWSQRTIWEYLRQETATREQPNELNFKLNDHYTKCIARLYLCFYPGREGFFEFRSGQSVVRAV